MISITVDVTKIDKSRIFPGKNGAKYIEIVLIETPNSQYGNDYMAAQSIPKKDRDAGQKGPIIGNAKIIGRKAAEPEPPSDPAGKEDDDIPF